MKGKRFAADRVVGSKRDGVAKYEIPKDAKDPRRDSDEMILIDIDASKDGKPNFAAIRALTSECYMPITVAGGVRQWSDFEDLFFAGADKVAVKTMLFENLALVREAAEFFGCQAIVAALDYNDTDDPFIVKSFAYACGAGEILLTSVDREGTMHGYNLDMIREVSQHVSVPVIAHGGCSGPEDMLKAIEAGASAVAAGALFQFTEWTPRSCAQWLADRGVETRV